MGVSCKPIGKFKSMLKKVQNEQEKEIQASKKVSKPKAKKEN